MNSNDYVMVYYHNQRHKIMLVKEYLIENGIEEVVELNKKGSMLLTGDIEIYVNRKEAEKAKKLIEEFEKNNEAK